MNNVGIKTTNIFQKEPMSSPARPEDEYIDLDVCFQEVYLNCKDSTLTSVERLYALYKAVEYVVSADVYGAIVECGVWAGGSMMCAAYSLLGMGDVSRNLFLYDTYCGMTEPGEMDVDALGDAWNGLTMAVPLEVVVNNMVSTGYPPEQIYYVQGDVQKTIPAVVPDAISILRLDTDWYASTRHELTELYPRLSTGGVIIVDDYGHWRGSRQAVDEYFGEARPRILLNRIDYSGRIGIKPQ